MARAANDEEEIMEVLEGEKDQRKGRLRVISGGRRHRSSR
jgi:hypothetical protein